MRFRLQPGYEPGTAAPLLHANPAIREGVSTDDC
jgi:hypothetical protein